MRRKEEKEKGEERRSEVGKGREEVGGEGWKREKREEIWWRARGG